MPQLSITADKTIFDQTVAAICDNAGWVTENGDQLEFAKIKILDWFGEQLRVYAEKQLKDVQQKTLEATIVQLQAARAAVQIDVIE